MVLKHDAEPAGQQISGNYNMSHLASRLAQIEVGVIITSDCVTCANI
jgi:hypothetical protein